VIQVSYCRRWNFNRNRPIDPYTEDEARARHEAGEEYCAVLGDPEAPDRVVEVVHPKAVKVWFFDPQQRQSLNYVFRSTGGDGMFLREMGRWQYPDDAARQLNEASRIENLRYDEDGTVHHNVRDKAAGENTSTSYRDVDVSNHTEAVPAFGEYVSIARWDRDVDPDPDKLS
jgi:hypothetical protein